MRSLGLIVLEHIMCYYVTKTQQQLNKCMKNSNQNIDNGQKAQSYMCMQDLTLNNNLAQRLTKNTKPIISLDQTSKIASITIQVFISLFCFYLHRFLFKLKLCMMFIYDYTLFPLLFLLGLSMHQFRTVRNRTTKKQDEVSYSHGPLHVITAHGLCNTTTPINKQHFFIIIFIKVWHAN